MNGKQELAEREESQWDTHDVGSRQREGQVFQDLWETETYYDKVTIRTDIELRSTGRNKEQVTKVQTKQRRFVSEKMNTITCCR